MKSLFEQNGGTYSTANDYRIPNLTVPDSSEHSLGIWGQRRLDYLKKHRRVLYINMLTSGKLTEHLSEIDTAVQELWDNIIHQMTVAQGVTEQLKAKSQIEWVGRMNNIRHSVDEVVLNEFIYD